MVFDELGILDIFLASDIFNLQWVYQDITIINQKRSIIIFKQFRRLKNFKIFSSWKVRNLLVGDKRGGRIASYKNIIIMVNVFLQFITRKMYEYKQYIYISR